MSTGCRTNLESPYLSKTSQVVLEWLPIEQTYLDIGINEHSKALFKKRKAEALHLSHNINQNFPVELHGCSVVEA